MGVVPLLEVLGGSDVYLVLLLCLDIHFIDHIMLKALAFQRTSCRATSAVAARSRNCVGRVEDLGVVAGDEGIHAGEAAVG